MYVPFSEINGFDYLANYKSKENIVDVENKGTINEIRYSKWRPSIHMPKEAARIFLKVKDVRVERLQDMTEDDAYAEGYKGGCPYEHRVHICDGYDEMCWNTDDCRSPINYCDMSIPEAFGIDIWDKTIKKSDLEKYGWDANPWVWVIEFERCEKPEDFRG